MALQSFSLPQSQNQSFICLSAFIISNLKELDHHYYHHQTQGLSSELALKIIFDPCYQICLSLAWSDLKQVSLVLTPLFNMLASHTPQYQSILPSFLDLPLCD